MQSAIFLVIWPRFEKHPLFELKALWIKWKFWTVSSDSKAAGSHIENIKQQIMTEKPDDPSAELLSLLVPGKCVYSMLGVERKWSTHYDSLNPWHIFLWEQMLLQPFKVITGPMNVILPRPRLLQSAIDKVENIHTLLVICCNYSDLQVGLIQTATSCLTFWDTIRKVSVSPSFTTSATVMLWPWTLRADLTSFTSSWD